MRRINMCKKINRNNDTGFFDHINRIPSRVNTVTPDIFLSQFDTHNGVQIIELNSSTDSALSEEPPDYNRSHAWSYASDDAFKELEESYRVNKKARDRKRLNNQNQFTVNFPVNGEDNKEMNNGYFMENNTNYNSYETFNDDIKINRQMNCFTILNNHFLTSETSSEDDRADVEMLRSEFPEVNWSDNNEYAEEIITYTDTDDTEKRTIWIYSFKNKGLLTENDFELLNISGKDTSSSCTEDLEEPVKDNRCRVGSPIPPAYIPRLNLCPTLSTVTEITEPLKHTSSNDSNSSIDDLFKQQQNYWFAKKGHIGTNLDKHDKSTNIINCMALSPREKRRRHLNANSDIIIDRRIKTLQEVCSSAKSKSIISSKDVKRNVCESRVKANIEVHVVNTIPDVSSILNPNSIQNNSTLINVNIDEIQSARVVDTIEECDIKNEVRTKIKPNIKISSKLVNKQAITDQMENFESSKRIIEETVEKQTDIFDYELDQFVQVCDNNDVNIETNSENDRVWTRNSSLIKPATWTEYLSITETLPSLNLSLSTATYSYIETSWIRRFFQLFRCCK